MQLGRTVPVTQSCQYLDAALKDIGDIESLVYDIGDDITTSALRDFRFFIQDAQSNIESGRSVNQDLRDLAGKYGGEADEGDRMYTELERELDRAQSDLDDYMSDFYALEKELADLRDEYEKLSEKYDDLEHEYRELQ